MDKLLQLLALFFSLIMKSLVDGAALRRQNDEQAFPISRCGPQQDGNIFICPSSTPCCSQHGYCGVESDDRYCMIAVGCQPQFSAAGSASCYPLNPNVTTSTSGFCGMSDDQDQLTNCPNEEGFKCCSESGSCGEDSQHCSITLGCQADYGICWDEATEGQDEQEEQLYPDMDYPGVEYPGTEEQDQQR